MQSKNISGKNKELFWLCKSISKNRLMQYRINKLIKRDPDWLCRNYGGRVSEEVLLELISKSYSNKKLQNILLLVIDLLDEKDITEAVFEMLINHPSNSRDSIIVSLCHKKLTENQLLVLCNIGTEFECFFELAHLYYRSEDASFHCLKTFLDRFKNGDFGYMYIELLRELLNSNPVTHSEKERYILTEIERY